MLFFQVTPLVTLHLSPVDKSSPESSRRSTGRLTAYRRLSADVSTRRQAGVAGSVQRLVGGRLSLARLAVR